MVVCIGVYSDILEEQVFAKIKSQREMYAKKIEKTVTNSPTSGKTFGGKCHSVETHILIHELHRKILRQ